MDLYIEANFPQNFPQMELLIAEYFADIQLIYSAERLVARKVTAITLELVLLTVCQYFILFW